MIVRAYSLFAASRIGRFLSRHVSWKLDPLLLRATRGRFATTLVFPTAVIETRGARSGAPRRNAVIYFHDGARVTIVASHAGDPRHPAWYYNLRAHPDVTFGGVPMRATVVEDDAERERLWVLADRVLPAFARYRRDAARANRTIPIVQLAERGAMNTDRNKAVVKEFDELGNGNGDLARLDDLCTPDLVNHALAPGAKPGIEGTREFLRRARRDVHPARWLESHVVAEGDMVVQFGVREHDWQGGSFRGFDVPAGTYTRDTAFAYRLVGGRIAERWAIRDDLSMLLQLGARRDER